MKKYFVFFVVLTTFFVKPCFAYKTEVHAILTDLAAKRSELSKSWVWRQMGFDSRPSSLPVTPYTPESEIIWENMPPNVDYAKLMAFGADIEDTAVKFVIFNDDNDPLYTEEVFASRAFNHFYNPQVNKKLFLAGLENDTSPDWMLEDNKFIVRQKFSYLDARQDFYRVFTSSAGINRLKAAAETIQTLGHVVHHIQDMAQPQHTRLDSHCDAPLCQYFFDEFFTYDQNDTSIYEVYTRDIIRCGESGPWGYGAGGAYKYPGSSPTPLKCDPGNLEDWDTEWWTKTLNLNSYPVVNARNLVTRDPKPRDFWSNENGTGMADFSSENFVSTDTAFSLEPCSGVGPECDLGNIFDRIGPHSSDLPLPNPHYGAVYSVNKVPFVDLFPSQQDAPLKLQGSFIEFISASFQDRYTGDTVTNPRLVSYSMFNERFTKKVYSPNLGNPVYNYVFSTPRRIFTTNYFNMDDHAALLIPRAVAYSAGLINYFFRYKLVVESVSFDENVGGVSQQITARVLIRNNSNYDLTTESYKILIETPSGSMSTVSTASNSVFPANSSRYFTIKFPSADYSGKASIVFYDTRPFSLNYLGLPVSEPAAEAGLFLELDLPEPTIACGESINTNGGQEGYSETMSMGTEDGPVLIQFDAFNIPDSLIIKNQNGQVKYSTGGAVSYYHEATLNYQFEQDGSLDVTVIGNVENSGTAWDLFVGCPNEGGMGSNIGKRYSFNYYFVANSAGYNCTGSVVVDGVRFDSSLDKIWLLPGAHTLSSIQNCSCNYTSCAFYDYPNGSFSMGNNNFTYQDASGGVGINVSTNGLMTISN